MNHEHIVLGGGCFWCVEAALLQIKGVVDVQSGYAGGESKNPTYESICTGSTGHAEVVRVTFDPSTISLDQLLSVFFTIHDPTTLNRQGNDVGTQYRSVIFYESEEQKATAQKVIASLESTGTWSGIVTEVKPLPEFYPAESYHQRYYEKNPDQAYCQIVISPKLAKLRQAHADLLK